MGDVLRAQFTKVLTATAFGIDLLGRPLIAVLRSLALLFVADPFGERSRQFIQITGAERNQFLVIEQVFDAFGQARPFRFGQVEGAEAQDEPLAGAAIGANRLQKAMIGVGAPVARDFDLTDEHAP